MNNKIKTAVALLSVLMLMLATAVNAFAYIADTTDSVTNTFVFEASGEPDIPTPPTPPDPPNPPDPPKPPSTPDQPTPDQPTPDEPVKDVVLEITINKIVDNLGNKTISPQGFEFELTDTDTGKVYTAVTDEKGIAVFKIKFTCDDIGKTYNFSLCEISGNIPGVVYSTEVYEFSVNVTLGANNKILPQCIMKNNAENDSFTFSFTNIYDAPPTPGDFSNGIFYIIMAAISLAGFVLLIYTKRTKI